MSQLLDVISGRSRIFRAWDVVKSRKVSAGVDDVTVELFSSSSNAHIKKICQELKKKAYQFQPSRRVVIDKSSGGTRNIHVFTVRDKIVQQALQSLLLTRKRGTSLFPEVYNDVAIAYIPRLNGVAAAVEKIKNLHAQGFIFITCLDIKDFFDKIPGDDLLKKITQRLPDNSIDWLIELTIKQKVYAIDDTVDRVLQGAVLAPLYSNIYLSDFDAFLIKNKIQAIRYADDLALFAKTEKEANEQKEVVRRALKKLTGMEFYPDNDLKKAPKNRCLNDFADFLGIRFTLGPRGLRIGPSPEKIDAQKQNLTEVFSSDEFSTFLRKAQRANRSIGSWCQHYYQAGAHQVPMRVAIDQITNHYAELSISFLHKIGVTPNNQSLNREQLNLLGVLGPTSIKR